MKIKWYGHSCFLITADSGTRILTDPYDPAIGYPMHNFAADIVTVSHDHHDHNALFMVQGHPELVMTEGRFSFGDINVTGIKTFHDDKEGTLRGMNLIFLFEVDGMRIAHMGDLGHMPSDNILKQLSKLDVLMAPVGGVYTMGPRLACDLANVLKAGVFIPMHYQTSALTLPKPLHPVDELIAVARSCKVHRLTESECSIAKESLGEDRLVVLGWDKGDN